MGKGGTGLKGIQEHESGLDVKVIGTGRELEVGSVIGQFITLVKLQGLVCCAKVHGPVCVLAELELSSFRNLYVKCGQPAVGRLLKHHNVLGPAKVHDTSCNAPAAFFREILLWNYH